MIISSQRYIDQSIVDDKIKNSDYVVRFVWITIDGVAVRHIVDGHHSYAAAKLAGVSPEWEICDSTQQEADSMDLDTYLEVHYIDSDWYDIETGSLIF